jgi:single-strand DNA-binding protein
MTRDVQVKNLPSGTVVAEFGIAVNHKYTSNGEKREEVMFLDCAAFGKLGEIISQYFSKGKPILVNGRLKLDQWEKDGQKRSKHGLVVENFTFVGGDRDGDAAPRQSSSMSQELKNRSRSQERQESPFSDDQQFQDADIPFDPPTDDRRSGRRWQ